MRILKMIAEGVELFRDDRLELDFFASDRVPKPDDGSQTIDVTRVGNASSIYAQNIVGISGVNASGKTTALNVLHFALDILAGEVSMRGFRGQDLTLGKVGERLCFTVTFWHDNSFYLLESELVRDTRSLFMGPSDFFGFIFEDETLWKLTTSRVNREMMADPKSFKKRAMVLHRRKASKVGENDSTVLTPRELGLLGDSRSIVSILTGRVRASVQTLLRELPTQSLAEPIVKAFDSSIELMEWNAADGVYTLKFKDEPPRVVNREVAQVLLSRGTVYGSEMVNQAIRVLSLGGYMLVDEMEEAINRSLAATVIDLFASPVTNPHGAQLVFSTHYPELLDALHRKDNVYLLVRGEDQRTEAVKYSTRVSRIENKKSDVVLSDLVKGTMPRYPDVRAMREYVRERVHEAR